ncbi:MAG: hypothetical protein AAF696_07150 [Bacteroidota bacterium]
MAIAASIATFAVGYIGIKFFTDPTISLATHYLWAIRLGFILFVIFSFEGFVMGANMAYTVGATDGAKGIPFLNWSLSHGDLRIAHFIGMHALQILPFLSFYLLKNTSLTLIVAASYALLAALILLRALQGNPIINLS